MLRMAAETNPTWPHHTLTGKAMSYICVACRLVCMVALLVGVVKNA